MLKYETDAIDTECHSISDLTPAYLLYLSRSNTYIIYVIYLSRSNTCIVYISVPSCTPLPRSTSQPS